MATHSNNMTPLENLYYALGELAYAVAFADGEVQKEEQEQFREFLKTQLEHNPHVDFSDIIFKLLEKKKHNSVTAYDWAINEVRTNSHYLSPELKHTFISVMENVAEAFPPVTKNEKTLLDRFRSDIAPLQGDPIYYGQT
jgi:uncharacterized tellurite resistance protein B-like protein